MSIFSPPAESNLSTLFLNSMARAQLETEREYCGAFHLANSSESAEKLGDWLLHLPRTLWELGASNIPASEVKYILVIPNRSKHETL